MAPLPFILLLPALLVTILLDALVVKLLLVCIYKIQESRKQYWWICIPSSFQQYKVLSLEKSSLIILSSLYSIESITAVLCFVWVWVSPGSSLPFLQTRAMWWNVQGLFNCSTRSRNLTLGNCILCNLKKWQENLNILKHPKMLKEKIFQMMTKFTSKKEKVHGVILSGKSKW